MAKNVPGQSYKKLSFLYSLSKTIPNLLKAILSNPEFETNKNVNKINQLIQSTPGAQYHLEISNAGFF